MKNIALYLVILSWLILYSCKNKPIQIENPNDFQFVFMTDIHLQPELNATQGFKQAIDSANKINPDFVITGGDLIMDAIGVGYNRADSLYNLYNETIKNFKMPVYNTLGNHELFGIYKESGVSETNPEYGEKMYKKRIAKRFYSFRHKDFVFFNLDAIEDTHKNGYIGKIDSTQLDWIKMQLDSIEKTTPIVITTHIPFMTVWPQSENGTMITNIHGLVVENAKEVLDLFKGHNLKLVLQGHLHFYEDIFVNNIHFVTGGAVCAKWWEGKRNGLEEGFLIVKVINKELSFEYKDYGWKVND
jgi:3',5'-cyclic AMP phosphodiesterase CpdA